MAENDLEKNQLRTGAEPDSSESEESTVQSGEENDSDKDEKPKGKSFEENVIRDSETAKQRGRNGGVKSGEVRRAKRDARECIQYLLGRMAKSDSIQYNLKELGAEETEFTNMLALQARLYSMAMSGNLEAYMTLMRMGGYEPEEIRRERESLAADRRREVELDAKVAAIGRGDVSNLSFNLQDEDGDNDVVIYMPQIESEEDCELEPESPAAEKTAE